MSAIRGLVCAGLASAAVGAGVQQAHAVATLTQGELTIEINETNGAINEVIFKGEPYYKLGVYVADYGFQEGTDTSTFQQNDIDGTEVFPVDVTSTSELVTVTGTYTGGSQPISFTRRYSLVSGVPVLTVDTTITNTGDDAITLRYFDEYDPDQGPGSSTINDVVSSDLGTVSWAQQASTGLVGAVGSEDPDVVTGFFPALGFDNGSQVNNFFDNPQDPNGSESDIGYAVGIELVLAAGESYNFVYGQAYGTVPADVVDLLVATRGGTEPPPPNVIPTPAAAAAGLMLLAGAIARRNRA